MTVDAWRVWDKDSSVEQRTYKRLTGELPEMECTKQLVELVSNVYKPGMKILDVGCAAGHYYRGLQRIDDRLEYWGVDATVPYIEYAEEFFKGNQNTKFLVGDIYALPENFLNTFDIVYCCNVILHLPTFQIPLASLLRATKKYCIIRTLVSENTHLSKFLYDDTYDEDGNPENFVHQNTYSKKIIQSFINSQGNYRIQFIDDKFDSEQIKNEYKNFNGLQHAVTDVKNNIQIAGSKVFEWKWIVIEKL